MQQHRNLQAATQVGDIVTPGCLLKEVRDVATSQDDFDELIRIANFI